MKSQFATYEIALKLKELGFDEECFGYYTPMKDWMMKGKYSDGKLRFHGPNWANIDNTMYFMYKANSFGDRTEVVRNSIFTKSISSEITITSVSFTKSESMLKSSSFQTFPDGLCGELMMIAFVL